MSESIPEAQRTAPKKIWLNLGAMGDIDMPYDPTDDVTWVDQPIDDNSIPYVRADLVDQTGSEAQQTALEEISLHRDAVDLADSAAIARREGRESDAVDQFRRAFQMESLAAEAFRDKIDAEPTRSILYRSAASLALDCGDPRSAEKLIARAVMGNPPGWIVNQLRILLKTVHFQRHRELAVELARQGWQPIPSNHSASVSNMVENTDTVYSHALRLVQGAYQHEGTFHGEKLDAFRAGIVTVEYLLKGADARLRRRQATVRAFCNSSELAAAQRTGGSFNAWLNRYSDCDVMIDVHVPMSCTQDQPIPPDHSANIGNTVKPAPVAASERLPGPDDLDADGRSWVYHYQNQKSTTPWLSARDLPAIGTPPDLDIPPGLTPIHYHTGTVSTIERTTLPPRPEHWDVRRGNECLTTDGNWVHEEWPSNRIDNLANWHALLDNFANWRALHRFPSLREAWEALQRANQSEDQP